MLSASKDAGGNTAEYYAADNYYSAGDNPADSQWLGEGARRAHLAGAIDADKFNEARDGRLPDGSAAAAKENRVPGWDFTFSAPKSVSVAALVGRDQRLIEAHRYASQSAMAYVERHAATRIREGKEVRRERTGNLVVGRFTHDTSRAGDPALHDHMYIMNRTWSASTKSWHALDSRSIYGVKETAGRIYSSVLRHQAKELGYAVSGIDANGNFQLTGVSQDLSYRFSKRRATIVEALKDTVQTTTRAVRERVALMTRGTKDFSLKGSAKTDAWRKEAAEHLRGLDATVSRTGAFLSRAQAHIAKAFSSLPSSSPAITDALQTPSRQTIVGSRRESAARQAVHTALRDMTTQSAVFHEADLVSAALQTPQAEYAHPADVIKLIDEHRRKGALVLAENSEPGHLTTRSALDLEKALITRISNADPVWRGSDGMQTDAIAKSRGLTRDQRRLFDAALNGSDRYKAVEGVAGAGKTYTLRAVAAALESHTDTLKLEVLAPLNEQVTDLKASGLDARTVSSFVHAHQHLLKDGAQPVNRSDRILAVDEAGQIANKDMDKLTRIAEAAGYGRVVLLGDPKQHGAIEAGAPLPLVLKMARADVRMTSIARQTVPVHKTAARLASQGFVGRALDVLGPALKQVREDTIEEAVFKSWRALPSAKRQDALVVLSNNARRAKAVELIRDALIHDKSLPHAERLGDKAFDAEQLQTVHLTDARINSGMGMAAGDRVIFTRNLRGIGVEKNDAASIVSVDKSGKTAKLKKDDGSTVTYKFPGHKHQHAHFRVYRPDRIEIREKDRMRWTRTDKERGFHAGTGFQIKSVEADHVVIQTGDNKELRLAKSDPQLRHIDYAYAATSYAAQGKTNATVIGGVGAEDRKSGTHQSLYVLLSRVGARGEDPWERLQIITNDKDGLISRLKGAWSKPDAATLHAVSENFKDTIAGKAIAPKGRSDAQYERRSAEMDRDSGGSRSTPEDKSPTRDPIQREPDRMR